MEYLKKAKSFDGVQFVLDNLEFDSLILLLDENISAYESYNESHKDEPIQFAESYINRFRKLKSVLCEISYFDEYCEEVHVMLGYYELQMLLDILIDTLPQSRTSMFEQLLTDPNTKRWTTKKKEE